MADIKRRDKSKKREEILLAAVSVFTETGYELASMDRIAQVANVSKRTVYNHFLSKEALFETMIAELLTQRRVLEKIPYDPKAPLDSQLRAFALAEIYQIDSPQRLELSRFLTVTFLKDLAFQRRMVGKFPGLHAMLRDWLAAARDDGRIQADDVGLAARVFYALVIGGVTWPVMFQERFDMQAAAPMITEVINVFLRRYGREEKPSP